MIIHVPNKNTLIIDDFKLRCCIGKKGLNSNKKEGDYSTPKGLFNLRKLYFRKDRVDIPQCKINKKIILEIEDLDLLGSHPCPDCSQTPDHFRSSGLL